MKIIINVVAYALANDLRELYSSCAGRDIFFNIFLHSQFPDVVETCEELAQRPHVSYYPYGYNRGLARSWNDGLILSSEMGADVCMIANDDALAASGDVHKLAQAAFTNPDKYMVSGMGLDMSTGVHKDMLFSLCAINPIALEIIGYFDQNFFPIYWEDIDWYYRARLAGLERMCVMDTNLMHIGSKSRWTNAANNAQHEITFPRNRAYYGRKWGCADQGGETYRVPFNDNRFGLKIAAEDRECPYPGYNREDTEIVTI